MVAEMSVVYDSSPGKGRRIFVALFALHTKENVDKKGNLLFRSSQIKSQLTHKIQHGAPWLIHVLTALNLLSSKGESCCAVHTIKAEDLKQISLMTKIRIPPLVKKKKKMKK